MKYLLCLFLLGCASTPVHANHSERIGSTELQKKTSLTLLIGVWMTVEQFRDSEECKDFIHSESRNVCWR